MKNEKICVSHYCEDCERKVYPSNQWVPGIIMGIVLMSVIGLSALVESKQSKKLALPFCQKVEELGNNIQKKTEIMCPISSTK